MEQQESFRGMPWNAEPSEDWNQPSYWDNYYRELLSDPAPWRRDCVVHRQVDLLIRMLTQAGELPPQSSPSQFLDAGCGIALIPHILAFWGFSVTAIDSCGRAIEAAVRLRPVEEELARCVPIWQPCKDMPSSYTLVNDPARSAQKLRDFQAPGGFVRYIASDWFSADLHPATFHVIYCRNSLRCSTKPYWRRSLLRFHDLLGPGGVLLLENVNAIGIQDEVEELLTEAGFSTIGAGTSREPPGKYVLSIWPTG